MSPKRYPIKNALPMIFTLAALAAIVVFSRTPETIAVESDNGRVRLEGQAPRRLGPFAVSINAVESDRPHTALVSSVYDITPRDVLLPQVLRLSITYEGIQIGSRNPADFVLARFDARRDRWEGVTSTVDFVTKTVTAEVRSLFRWGIMVREDVGVPEGIGEVVNRLLSEMPVDMVGYTADLDYARVPGDFVLYRPAYRRDGCSGFFEGDEERVVQESRTINDITFRVTVTWELGDTARCNRRVVPVLGSPLNEMVAPPGTPQPPPPCNAVEPNQGDCPPSEPYIEITWEICDGVDNDGDGEIDEGWDSDADGLVDCRDNCAPIANPDQRDSDIDGVGDACEAT